MPTPASARSLLRALAVFEGVFGVVGALALAVLAAGAWLRERRAGRAMPG